MLVREFSHSWVDTPACAGIYLGRQYPAWNWISLAVKLDIVCMCSSGRLKTTTRNSVHSHDVTSATMTHDAHMRVKNTPRHKTGPPSYTFRKNCKFSPHLSTVVIYEMSTDVAGISTRSELIRNYIRYRLDCLLYVHFFVTLMWYFMSTLCLTCGGCRQIWDLMLFHHFQLSVSEHDSQTFQINCSYIGRQ